MNNINNNQERSVAPWQNDVSFNSYFNMPLHGIAITSASKDWLQVNDELCSLLGYSREELLKMTWLEITHPDDITEDEERFNRILDGEIEHYSLKKRFIHKNGKIVWVNLSVGCVRKPDGQVDYIIALLADITEQKKLENELIKEKSEQQMILDAIPAWIFYKDNKNTFIKVNQSFADAVGLPKEKLEGKSLFDIFPKEQADKFAIDDQTVIKSQKPLKDIIESLDTPNGILWLKTDKIPYINEANEVVGIIGFAVNITAQKIAEDKITAHNEEIEKMNQFMMDRELKMVELKEEITALKKQITA